VVTAHVDVIQQTITERSFDVLAVIETRLNGSDDVCLRLSIPPVYAVVDVARTSGRGGGVAIILSRQLECSLLPVPNGRTLEVLCVRLITTSGPVVIAIQWRRQVSEVGGIA